MEINNLSNLYVQDLPLLNFKTQLQPIIQHEISLIKEALMLETRSDTCMV